MLRYYDYIKSAIARALKTFLVSLHQYWQMLDHCYSSEVTVLGQAASGSASSPYPIEFIVVLTLIFLKQNINKTKNTKSYVYKINCNKNVR